jgi:hypothetical protein
MIRRGVQLYVQSNEWAVLHHKQAAKIAIQFYKNRMVVHRAPRATRAR